MQEQRESAEEGIQGAAKLVAQKMRTATENDVKSDLAEMKGNAVCQKCMKALDEDANDAAKTSVENGKTHIKPRLDAMLAKIAEFQHDIDRNHYRFVASASCSAIPAEIMDHIDVAEKAVKAIADAASVYRTEEF